MTPSIITAALWVLAATGTAMLPMRFQYGPGLVLLIMAPVLILWLGVQNGWWLAIAATVGFVSMFRNPLRYIWRKLIGQKPDLPK